MLHLTHYLLYKKTIYTNGVKYLVINVNCARHTRNLSCIQLPHNTQTKQIYTWHQNSVLNEICKTFRDINQDWIHKTACFKTRIVKAKHRRENKTVFLHW